ncbi:MAG: DUF5036 family protein [Prevotellaceae bacterium]|jgi:hypothetical protein|nr:DUF5036 family protein [Prevotellaceae bacterium]
MKKFNLFFVQTLMILSLTFVIGCSKDGGGDSVPDPEGTMSLSMRAFDGRVTSTYLYWTDSYHIGISLDNNFRCHSNYPYKQEVVNIGRVNGLGSIKKTPSSGWTTGTAVEPGSGYVFRMNDAGGYTYARLYVVEWIIDTSGGIMGAKVKYQYPFNPE